MHVKRLRWATPITKHRKRAGIVAVILVLLTTAVTKSSIFANDGIPTEQAAKQTNQDEIKPTEQLTAPSTAEGAVETRGGLPAQQRHPGSMQMVVPGSAPPQMQVVPPPPLLTWHQLWDQVWRSLMSAMPLEVAASVGQVPICQDNLAFDAIIRDTTWAIANRKYGEAARLLGLFQDRSHCLTPRGLRSLDAAMTVYLVAALRNLRRDQADIAVPGIFSFGLLIFDQLQYTKASFWRPGIAPRAALVQQILTTASSRDMGVWLYDFNRGLLEQRTDMGLKEEILSALANPSRLGDGHCSLVEMADLRQKSSMGFQCPRGGQYGAGGAASQSGSSAISGIVPTPTGAMCIAEVARTSGPRQQLACMQKAVAGIKPTPAEMLKGPVWNPPVLDKGCAISDAPAGGLIGSMQEVVDPKILRDWQDAKARLRTAKAEEEMLKQAIEDTNEAALIEANNEILRQELREAQGSSSSGGSSSPPCPPSKLACGGESGDKRTVGDDLGGPGGCGKASNAAMRLRTLYQCLGGSTISGPPRISGGGVSPNPTIAYIEPDSQTVKMPAAVACAVQGGDMARMSMNDSQCAAMRCVEGQICPCNRTASIGANQMQPRQPRPGVIDCAPGDFTGGAGLGPCEQKPTAPGTAPVPPKGGGPTPEQGPSGGPPGVK